MTTLIHVEKTRPHHTPLSIYTEFILRILQARVRAEISRFDSLPKFRDVWNIDFRKWVRRKSFQHPPLTFVKDAWFKWYIHLCCWIHSEIVSCIVSGDSVPDKTRNSEYWFSEAVGVSYFGKLIPQAHLYVESSPWMNEKA